MLHVRACPLGYVTLQRKTPPSHADSNNPILHQFTSDNAIMAPKPPTTGTTLERSLTSTINDTVSNKNNWETSIDIRTLAAKSIGGLIVSWNTHYRLQNDSTDPEDTVDKLHFVYTAAQKLNCYRNNTDALPAKIIACFTEQIKGSSTPTVGLMKEILEAGTKVQTTQQRRIKAEQRDIARALAQAAAQQKKGAEFEGDNTVGGEEQEASKKRKGGLDGGGDMAFGGGTPAADVPAATKKIKISEKSKATGALSPQEDGNADGQEASTNNTVPAAIAPSTAPSLKQTTPSSATEKPRSGPGNFNRENYTKWYPDEEAFLKDLITANPTWTYQQYADANTARFKDTYYVDGDGVQQPGKREGRTANSVALRYRVFRQGIMKAAKEAEGTGGDGSSGAYEVDAAAGVSTTAGESSKRGKEGGSSKDQEADATSKNSSAEKRKTSQAQDSNIGGGSSTGQGGAPGASTATGGSRQSGQADASQPVRIYTSGVVVAVPRGSSSDSEVYPPQFPGSGPGANPDRDNPDSDEDPVGDLEDAVRGGQGGTRWY